MPASITHCFVTRSVQAGRFPSSPSLASNSVPEHWAATSWRACRRGAIPYLDRARLAATGRLSGRSRGQAGERGSAAGIGVVGFSSTDRPPRCCLFGLIGERVGFGRDDAGLMRVAYAAELLGAFSNGLSLLAQR